MVGADASNDLSQLDRIHRPPVPSGLCQTSADHLDFEHDLWSQLPRSREGVWPPQVGTRENHSARARHQHVDRLVRGSDSRVHPEGDVTGELLKVVQLWIALLDPVEVDDVEQRVLGNQPVQYVKWIKLGAGRRVRWHGAVRPRLIDVSRFEQQARDQPRARAFPFAGKGSGTARHLGADHAGAFRSWGGRFRAGVPTILRVPAMKPCPVLKVRLTNSLKRAKWGPERVRQSFRQRLVIPDARRWRAADGGPGRQRPAAEESPLSGKHGVGREPDRRESERRSRNDTARRDGEDEASEDPSGNGETAASPGASPERRDEEFP